MPRRRMADLFSSLGVQSRGQLETRLRQFLREVDECLLKGGQHRERNRFIWLLVRATCSLRRVQRAAVNNIRRESKAIEMQRGVTIGFADSSRSQVNRCRPISQSGDRTVCSSFTP
jgi:hypothetical protein